MKVDDKLQILKFLALVFNSVFLILGLCIFGCGVWFLFDKNNFVAVLSSAEVNIVAGGLFIIGLVVVAVTILGCLGAQLENRCFLLLYMGFLICIVLGQLFVIIVLLINWRKIQSTLEVVVENIISEYGSNPVHETYWTLLDDVQHYGECCGLKGPDDWKNNLLIQNNSLSDVYPCSCFNTTVCPSIPGFSTRFGEGNETVYLKGCQEEMTSWLQANIYTVVGMVMGLLLSQILQFILSVFIYQTVGQKNKMRNENQLIRSEDQGIPNIVDPDLPETNQTNAHTNLVYPEETLEYPEPVYSDPHQSNSATSHVYHR